MAREIEVERTARILKQADPHVAPPPVRHTAGGDPPTSLIAVIAAVVAFIAILLVFLR